VLLSLADELEAVSSLQGIENLMNKPFQYYLLGSVIGLVCAFLAWRFIPNFIADWLPALLGIFTFIVIVFRGSKIPKPWHKTLGAFIIAFGILIAFLQYMLPAINFLVSGR
jgi:hypothetical protein